jgi:hypothetical protein
MMASPPHPWRLVLAAGAVLAAATAGPAAGLDFGLPAEQLTAVSAKQFNGYQRTTLPDGSFRPESYVFGNGSVLPTYEVPGLITKDPSIDDLGFDAIAGMIAPSLAREHFTMARDPAQTQLLIMVYWARNIGTADVNEIDAYNAELIGFDELRHILGADAPDPFNTAGTMLSHITREVHADLLGVVQVDRYIVILRAFDFQAAWRRKSLRMLWETRFSVAQRTHDFAQDLPVMARSAAPYFGQDSYGFVRVPLAPEGRVDLGEIRMVDDAPLPLERTGAPAPAGLVGDWRGAVRGGPPVTIHVPGSGGASFENSRYRDILPARVALSASAVTITVPGWDILLRGTLERGRIVGTLSEYGQRSGITLTRAD